MKSADIEVGGFYAVKSYQRKAGVRAEVLAVGVARYHYAEDARPDAGRYVLVRMSAARGGNFYESRVGPAAVLRKWTNVDDDSLRVDEERTARDAADLVRLNEMVEAMHLGDDVVVSYRGLECRSHAAAIALLERVR